MTIATDAELASCREWIDRLRANGNDDSSPVVLTVGMVDMLLNTIDKAREDAVEDCTLFMQQRNEAVALLRQVSDIADGASIYLGHTPRVVKDIGAWLKRFDNREVKA